MSALKIVQNLRDLAMQPQNRVAIVKDQGCLPGLVLFLDNDDSRVVLTALETLRYLSLCPSNRVTMRNEIGMLVSLKAILNKNEHSKSCQLAREIHNTLVPSSRNTRSNRTGSTSSHFFMSNANKNARIITLQISGMIDSRHRSQCEKQLLATPGVISFTFDLTSKRCVVRASQSLKVEAICQAIALTKSMAAQQVIKNDMGEEVFLSFGSSPAVTSENKENAIPDYLPEDDESIVEKKAIARVNDDNANNNGWLNNVTNFLTKTFYW